MSLFGKHKDKNHAKEVLKGHSISTMIDNTSKRNTDLSKGPPLPESEWVDQPLMMCVNKNCTKYLTTNYEKQIAIPLNTVFEFESKVFRGKGIVRAIDLPNTDKSYFKGRNRKMDFTFQGQFKRRICFDRVYTGQVFDKPFTKLPGHYLVSAAFKLVKALAPSLRADVNCDTPYMISPLASAAQVFQITKPGKEIPLPLEPKEDVSALGEKFNHMTWTDRKKYFHDLEHLKDYYFEPGYNYTISCYSHMISPTGYTVHMLGMKCQIHQYIPGPMQIATIILPPTHSSAPDDDTSLESTSNDTNDELTNIETSPNSNNSSNGHALNVPEQPLETMMSEELGCESKDDEEIEFDHTGEDLTKCEFLVNFELWHDKLVDELYPDLKKEKKNNKKSSSWWGK